MLRSSRRSLTVSASALACAAAFSWVSSAQAQTAVTTTTPAPVAPAPAPAAVVVQQPAAPVATTTTTSAPVASTPGVRETKESGYVPNPYLLVTGLVLWGVPYTAGVITAAQSSNQADQHLYVPIVGPWIDLANRGGCPVGNNSCNTETTNKVLLGVDGVFQAIGTLEVIWAFLRPEHREVTTVAATKYTPAITFSPANVASGYGMAAFATF